MSLGRAVRISLALALLAAPGAAQTLADLRDQLRGALGNARQTAFLAGLVDLGESRGLSGGQLRVQGDPELDLTLFKLPAQRELPLGDGLPELHLEGGVGYLEARAEFADIFGGGLPGLETAVRSRWTGYSVYSGVGPRFDLGAGLHVTPLVDISLSYVENVGLYSGPGTPLASALFNGLLFNWHAASVAYGGALRLEHDADLGDELKLASRLRYDLRQFEGITSTDPAQDGDDELQRVVARSELSGPFGFALGGQPVGWATHLAYVRFVGSSSDILGFRDYVELGGTIRWPLPAGTPLFGGVSLAAALLWGEDVRGWNAGVALSF